LVYKDELNFKIMNLQKRNQAIFECHKLGINQTIIGQIFNKNQSTISKVIAQVKAGANVPKEETRGSKPKLSVDQKEELKEILQKPPTDYGYTIWDKWSIKDILFKKFEVNYHQNSISKIMKCINFSSQKPQQKDYRQDPEKVSEFKETKIPEVKKSQFRK